MKFLTLLLNLISVITLIAALATSKKAESPKNGSDLSTSLPVEEITSITTAEPLSVCEEIVLKENDNLQRFLLTGSDKFPSTIAQVREHCELASHLYKSLRGYGRTCLKSLSKQLFSFILKGIKKIIKSTCSATGIKRTAETLKCATKDSIKGWKDCLNIFDRQLYAISVNTSIENIFGDLCCMYVGVDRHITARIHKDPECVDSKHNVPDFFRNIFEAILKDAMDLACGKFVNQEQCEKHNPKGLELLKFAETADFKSQGYFLLGPLLDIIPKLS